jgi:predicted acyltransferase
VPIALGLIWLPALRTASKQWVAAFMALTAGLLTFLAVEALSEALELQATLPGRWAVPGSCCSALRQATSG